MTYAAGWNSEIRYRDPITGKWKQVKLEPGKFWVNPHDTKPSLILPPAMRELLARQHSELNAKWGPEWTTDPLAGECISTPFSSHE